MNPLLIGWSSYRGVIYRQSDVASPVEGKTCHRYIVAGVLVTDMAIPALESCSEVLVKGVSESPSFAPTMLPANVQLYKPTCPLGDVTNALLSLADDDIYGELFPSSWEGYCSQF